MIKQWPETTDEIKALMRTLRGDTPNVMKAFSGLAQAALAPQALDCKTKELIALGISVAIRCDDCIGFHVKAALDQGATREEIVEALGMAVYMGAGPAVMYATHALDAFEQFQNASQASTAA
jgi:AhpD family alkylhydroperoxidase